MSGEQLTKMGRSGNLGVSGQGGIALHTRTGLYIETPNNELSRPLSFSQGWKRANYRIFKTFNYRSFQTRTQME